MTTKLVKRKSEIQQTVMIPYAQLGAIIQLFKNKINNIRNSYQDIVDSIPGNDSYNEFENSQYVKRKKDSRYNPEVEKLQRQLYNIGAFGNSVSSKVVDGINGPKTQSAIKKAIELGYNVDNFKVYKSFFSRLKDAWYNLTGSGKPTLEQFKEQKRQQLRKQAAKVNAENPFPNFPQMDVGPWKGHDMDVRGKKGWNDERIRKEFTQYAVEAQNYLNNHHNLDPLTKQRIQESLTYYKKVAKNPKYIDTHGGGFGCIYTASGVYGDKYKKLNNKQLSDAIARGDDTGFIQIFPDEYQVGDIVQMGLNNGKSYNPHHAEMVTDTFMGYPKLAQNSATGYGTESKSNNWSNAREATRNAKNNGEEFRVLRFVGTKDQNKKWEEEYYKLYG